MSVRANWCNPRTNERPSVLCFGEALWDMLPEGRRAGGAPLNVAVRLAQCGVDARLLSRVGCDADGDALLNYLDSVGLSRQYVQRDEAHATGAVRVDTSNSQAPRYTIEPMAAWDFIDAEPYLRLAAQPIEVLVFGSLAARHAVARQALLTLLDRARLKVLDVNLRPPFDDAATLRLLLERADWVKVNEQELRLIGAAGRAATRGATSIEALARSVQASYGLAALCVTLGEQGAVLLRGDDIYRQRAYALRVVDTIGCGDAFLATWLAAMLAPLDPAAALEQAAAAAALVASSAGATRVCRTDDIRQFIAAQRRR